MLPESRAIPDTIHCPESPLFWTLNRDSHQEKFRKSAIFEYITSMDSTDNVLPDDASLSSIDLLKRKHSLEIALLHERFGVRESELTRELQTLKNRALTAEQSAKDIRSKLRRVQSDLSAAKSSAHRYHTNLLEYAYKHDSILRQLFASFGCTRLEDVLSIADHYRARKVELELLQNRLLDAQLERSATALPPAPSDEVLKERLADVEIQRESDRRRFTDELEAKQREVRRIADDLARADDQIRMMAENAKARAGRLQMLAARLDPEQFGIQRESVLFGLFEAIVLLLRSIGDPEMDPEAVARGLEDAANRAVMSDATRRVTELEVQIAELSQELEEMRQDDKAPEVFALTMKVREQSEQIQGPTLQLATRAAAAKPRPSC
jgi:hypothetical protein